MTQYNFLAVVRASQHEVPAVRIPSEATPSADQVGRPFFHVESGKKQADAFSRGCGEGGVKNRPIWQGGIMRKIHAVWNDGHRITQAVRTNPRNLTPTVDVNTRRAVKIAVLKPGPHQSLLPMNLATAHGLRVPCAVKTTGLLCCNWPPTRNGLEASTRCGYALHRRRER